MNPIQNKFLTCRCLIICMLATLLSSCNTHTQIEARTIAILHSYGLYNIPSKFETSPQKIILLPKYRSNVMCLQKFTAIIADTSTMIGIKFEITDFQKDTQIDDNKNVLFSITAPALLYGDKTSGSRTIFTRSFSYNEALELGGFFWSFKEEKDQIPGEWIFQISHDNRVILEKTFNVNFRELIIKSSNENKRDSFPQTFMGLWEYGEYEMRPEWSGKGIFFPCHTDKLSLVKTTDRILLNNKTTIGVFCYLMGVMANKQERFVFKLIPPVRLYDKINKQELTFQRTLEELRQEGCAFIININNFYHYKTDIPEKWTVQVLNSEGVILLEKYFLINSE